MSRRKFYIEDFFNLETFLYLIPFFVSIIYLIICFTPAIQDMGMDVSDNVFFDGIAEDGWYDFYLANTALEWMEEGVDDINFFLILPVGLLQLALLIVGGVVDLAITFLLIILGVLWVIISIIFQFCCILIIPAAAAIASIILLIVRVREDESPGLVIMSVLSSIFSVICIVFYFVTFFRIYG